MTATRGTGQTPQLSDGEIAIDNPRRPDVQQLLGRHLAFARSNSPPEDVHALDTDRLTDSGIAFYSLRQNGMLLGIGALKTLDDEHGELKSMHTAEAVRGHGVGKAMLDHLIHEARKRGFKRLSLETGAMEVFAPARRLYAKAGFQPCEPFGRVLAQPK